MVIYIASVTARSRLLIRGGLFRYFGRKYRKGDCLGLCTFVLIYSSMSILVIRCTTLTIFWNGRVCESMLCYLLVRIIAKLVIPCLNLRDLCDICLHDS